MKSVGQRLCFAKPQMQLCKTPWEGFTYSFKARPGEPEFSCIGKVCSWCQMLGLLGSFLHVWFVPLITCHPFRLVATNPFLKNYLLPPILKIKSDLLPRICL